MEGTPSSLVSEPLICPTTPCGPENKNHWVWMASWGSSSHTAFPAYKQGQQHETVDFMKPLLAFQAKH